MDANRQEKITEMCLALALTSDKYVNFDSAKKFVEDWIDRKIISWDDLTMEEIERLTNVGKNKDVRCGRCDEPLDIDDMTAPGPFFCCECARKNRLEELAAENRKLRNELKDLERSQHQILEERDNAQEWADKLAYSIGSVEEIGEHSNMNNPWKEAEELAHQLHADLKKAREHLAWCHSCNVLMTTIPDDVDSYRCPKCAIRATPVKFQKQEDMQAEIDLLKDKLAAIVKIAGV